MTAKNNIDHPEHYTAGGIETIDIIMAKLTPEEGRGFLKGNVIKYLTRSGKKDDELQDLKKAKWYLAKMILELEKKVER